MLVVSLVAATSGKIEYSLVREKVNWTDAFRMCTDEPGFRLSAIQSADETQAVKVFLEKETNQGEKSPCRGVDDEDFHFWTAGQRLDEGQAKPCDRPFYWKFPKDLEEPFDYTDWAPKEPDCAGGNEACVEVPYNTNFQWNDAVCTELKCPLCQKV